MSGITFIRRDQNDGVNIVRIVSEDSLASVGAAGYLTAQASNIAALNNAEVSNPFDWEVSDMVLVYASDGWGLFTIASDFTRLNLFVDASSISTTLADGDIFIGNASNVATARAVTGDVVISNTGVTSISSGVIVNADINASAAIAYSKLAALPSGDILVGSAGNVATAVAMSGDATISNVGALTIANDAITTAKILNANVTLAKLASGITPSHVIKFANQVTTAGGAAAEAFTVNGAVGATDRAFVQVVDNGTANVTVLQAVVTDNTLTVTFSADPGNDTVINYQIIRAAS